MSFIPLHGQEALIGRAIATLSRGGLFLFMSFQMWLQIHVQCLIRLAAGDCWKVMTSINLYPKVISLQSPLPYFSNRLLLLASEKYGRGDWRNIFRCYVLMPTTGMSIPVHGQLASLCRTIATLHPSRYIRAPVIDAI